MISFAPPGLVSIAFLTQGLRPRLESCAPAGLFWLIYSSSRLFEMMNGSAPFFKSGGPSDFLLLPALP